MTRVELCTPWGLFCDCETEQAEEAFRKRLADLVRQMGKGQRRDVWREMRARWWHGPVRWERISSNPGLIVGVESVLPGGTEAEQGSAIYPEDSAGPSTAKDERPHVADRPRHDALEIGCYWLGITSPIVRFFDPVPISSLERLPPKVAQRIAYIARRCDRGLADTMRRVNQAFRVACKSLNDADVFKRWEQIHLHYGGRVYCLLRHYKDIPTRRGSGRTAGCKFTLLSEEDDAVLKEIVYFRKHDKVIPSARRFIKPNPLLAKRSSSGKKRYFEDGRSVRTLFVGPRPRRSRRKRTG